MRLLNVSFDKAVRGPDGSLSTYHVSKSDYSIEIKGSFVVMIKGNDSTVSPISNMIVGTVLNEKK